MTTVILWHTVFYITLLICYTFCVQVMQQILKENASKGRTSLFQLVRLVKCQI